MVLAAGLFFWLENVLRAIRVFNPSSASVGQKTLMSSPPEITPQPRPPSNRLSTAFRRIRLFSREIPPLHADRGVPAARNASLYEDPNDPPRPPLLARDLANGNTFLSPDCHQTFRRTDIEISNYILHLVNPGAG